MVLTPPAGSLTLFVDHEGRPCVKDPNGNVFYLLLTMNKPDPGQSIMVPYRDGNGRVLPDPTQPMSLQEGRNVPVLPGDPEPLMLAEDNPEATLWEHLNDS